MHEPIKVTAHIYGPVAFHRDEGLTLDGPLAWALALEQRGDAFFAAAPDNDELEILTADPDPAFPLAVHCAGGTWCYATSSAEIEGDHGTEISHWNKRFDDRLASWALADGKLSDRKLRVPTASGEFKSYHQPLFEEVVERLVWYAVGDGMRVAELLDRVQGLGKKRNTGHGRVLRWEVERSSEPEDRWLWREPGVLARPVPIEMLGAWSGETMWVGYRPPYWLAGNQAVCAVGEA